MTSVVVHGGGGLGEGLGSGRLDGPVVVGEPPLTAGEGPFAQATPTPAETTKRQTRAATSRVARRWSWVLFRRRGEVGWSERLGWGCWLSRRRRERL